MLTRLKKGTARVSVRGLEGVCQKSHRHTIKFTHETRHVSAPPRGRARMSAVVLAFVITFVCVASVSS